MAVKPTTFVASPFQGARGLVIAPFQFETTADDNLQIVSANSLAGVVLAIQGRRRTVEGTIEPFAFTHTPNSDRSSKTQIYALGAGALLNLTIFATSGTPMIGQTYVMARLIRGLFGATFVLGGLLGGYVTSLQHLSYPGSPIQSSIDGGGYYRDIIGTTPAAGIEVNETVPTGARWQLLSVFANFTTGVAVANRLPQVVLTKPDTNFKCRIPLATTIPASTVGLLTWASGLQRSTEPSATRPNAGLPTDAYLLAAGGFQTTTDNIQAADQYVITQYSVREWLEVS